MIQRLIFLIVAAAGLFFIVFQVIKFLFSVSNPKSRVEKDRNYGLIKMRQLSEMLIPFNGDELQLLTLYRNGKSMRKTFHSEETGQLTTIYGEQLIAYYLFDYLDNRKLLLTENTEFELEIYKENNNVNVWYNGKLKYTITPAGELRDVSGNTVYGKLVKAGGSSYYEIEIGPETKAHITSVMDATSMQSRAYPIVKLEDTEEILVCYILTLYHLFI